MNRENWSVDGTEYSGDVSLDGNEPTPVGVGAPEDVYVTRGGVGGDLHLLDAEHVFTMQSPDGGSDPPAPATVIDGDLEDAYAADVDGTAVVRDPADAFVPHGAVDGALGVVGAERVFEATGPGPRRDPAEYDVALTGWRRSATEREARVGVAVAGAHSELTVETAEGTVEVYVTGRENEVRIDGGDGTVRAYFVGRDNRLSVGPYLDATVVAEAGFDNEVSSDPLPPEALVETTKEAALADATFGRHRVTYQVPADADVCPNPGCGRRADAVIERKYRDAFFLFGTPVWTFEAGAESYECERCTRRPVTRPGTHRR